MCPADLIEVTRSSILPLHLSQDMVSHSPSMHCITILFLHGGIKGTTSSVLILQYSSTPRDCFCTYVYIYSSAASTSYIAQNIIQHNVRKLVCAYDCI